MSGLIPHPEIQAVVENLRGRISERDRIILANYVIQCNQTSRDLQATVRAILDLCGPEKMNEIRQRVEAARLPVFMQPGKKN